ncbi:MAG: DUF2806 domain-containing protein [Sphingopyxis solisilvae]|uniref:DUF2806 domain-containing protein n=1 Tax=Sphingopyxis solisilvae TaxID=1886788 RepID=UPI0040360E0A
MDTEPNSPNLPAQIAEAISGVPKALVPSSIKALDRLIGAAVDIPVAWLGQKKAKIDAQTQAYAAVEAAIAVTAASEAGATPEIIQQAMNVLVRKEYRKQNNRNAVGQAALEDLRSSDTESTPLNDPEEIDDDWLNIFERYAEDASTERMQKLWGRVLSGEIRNPGAYSLRTLRFLSEFSQADALTFAEFCDSAFGEAAPKKLVKPDTLQDIRSLLYLESSGLINGADGIGLQRTMTFREDGTGYFTEKDLAIFFKGKPGTKFVQEVVALTPLGQELLTLLPARDPRAAAKRVAEACKSPQIEEAYLVRIVNERGDTSPIEIFWQGTTEAIDNPNT